VGAVGMEEAAAAEHTHIILSDQLTDIGARGVRVENFHPRLPAVRARGE